MSSSVKYEPADLSVPRTVLPSTGDKWQRNLAEVNQNVDEILTEVWLVDIFTLIIVAYFIRKKS